MATLDTFSGLDLDSGASRRGWVDLALLLASRRRLLLGTVAAAAAIAAAAALLLPDVYVARTTILPPQQSQSLVPAMLGQLGGLAALGGRDLALRNPADLYAGILQSDTVADELVARFRLLERYGVKRLSDAKRKLAERTAVIVRPKEGLVDVEVRDRDPKAAAEIANAYIDLLFGMNAKLALTEASQRRQFFEEQLRASGRNLVQAEAALKGAQESTGMVQLDAQAKAAVQAVATLRGQIAAKEIQLRAMNAFATEENPDVLVAREELAGMRSQLNRLEARGGAGEIGVRGIPQAGLAYVRGMREVAYQEALYEILAKQYEAARIDEAKSAPVIQVVDKARAPDRKSGPPRALLVAAATAACLFLAVLLILLRDRWRAADPETQRKLAAVRALAFGRPW